MTLILPHLGHLLLHLLPQNGLYVVVLDRTEWHVGETPVNILMMGIAHKSVAFPIAWTVLSSGGESGAQVHIDALEHFLKIVDPKSIEAVVADREFILAEWLARLQQRGIPFTRTVALGPE